MNYNQGFTLLEALVAIVLIGVLGGVLYSFLSVSLQNLRRLSDRSEALVVENQIRRFITAQNLLARPEGSDQVGSWQVNWQSQPIETIRKNVGRSGLGGNFNTGLFQVTVSVTRPNATPIHFSMRQLTYQRITQRVQVP